MREEQLCESTSALLALEPEQAFSLSRLGAQLASRRAWWGASRGEDDRDERSVIRVEAAADGRFRVTVHNMIGAIALDGVNIRILPKIPLCHFLHIVLGAGIQPRAGGVAQLEPDESLAELVARWFIADAEVLVRRGLRSEYAERSEELTAVRGQVQLLETAMLIQQGRPVAVCRFDELAPDSPLNRLVKAAAREIAMSAQFSAHIRHRARLIRRRMDGVGDETPSDFQVAIDCLARHYATVVPLAKLVLLGLGIGIQFGDTAGRTFLLRTPELIEGGIRRMIAGALPGVQVEAGRLMLGRTGLSLNPDLVFDRGRAVGDVKYKLLSRSWNRADLYQALAFATAYRTRHALTVGFHNLDVPRPSELVVGDVACRVVAWDARNEVQPKAAQAEFERDLRRWRSERFGADDAT
ncbi:MAG TPA: hypothetical protein VGF12_10550, partial [Roseateles sp.]|uniref:McrC family protein n=1 Tax=Roseateles sp. TaxID=1971397 RepID=UPI002EDB0AA9